MQITGSIKSVHSLEKILTTAFNSICIKDGSGWLAGENSKTFTRIHELYPDGGNPFQRTVWLRFTYCLQDDRAEMKVSRQDVARFLKAITKRNIRLGTNGGDNGKASAKARESSQVR